jgi:branched-chain amino acid aminotransferase
VSNLFLVNHGGVLTPSLSSGCLPGITRGLVIEMCGQLGIPCLEKSLTPSDLAAADGIFLTNSLHGILPAAMCDQRPLEAPCPVTARLAAALEDLWARLPDP